MADGHPPSDCRLAGGFGGLDKDGKLDLAIANRADNSISVLLNGACTP